MSGLDGLGWPNPKDEPRSSPALASLEIVRREIARLLPVPLKRIHPYSRLDEDLDRVELAMALETACQVEFPLRSEYEWVTVEDVALGLRQLRAGRNEVPIEIALCEIPHITLRPGRLYRPVEQDTGGPSGRPALGSGDEIPPSHRQDRRPDDPVGVQPEEPQLGAVVPGRELQKKPT